MAVAHVDGITQVEPTVSPASVLIKFTVLGVPPDNVQVYVGGVSGDLAELKEEVDMAPPENEYSSLLTLAGGTAFRIHLCPRTFTDGIPDDRIDEQFFESFCTQIDFTTKAPPGPPGPHPLRAPTKTSIEPHHRTLHQHSGIRVSWSSSESFDKYHFMHTSSFPPPPAEAGWSAFEVGSTPRSFDIP